MNKFSLPTPFLGRIIIEISNDNLKEHFGLSKDSVLALPELHQDRVPLKTGKIISMAPDAFGERFKKNYGSDFGRSPQIGDKILYVPFQGFGLDTEGKYRMINDEHVCGVL